MYKQTHNQQHFSNELSFSYQLSAITVHNRSLEVKEEEKRQKPYRYVRFNCALAEVKASNMFEVSIRLVRMTKKKRRWTLNIKVAFFYRLNKSGMSKQYESSVMQNKSWNSAVAVMATVSHQWNFFVTWTSSQEISSYLNTSLSTQLSIEA